jgi:hypothetical protein
VTDNTIDRRALVERHNVEVTRIVPASPLSVGNGEFCFTVDVTGLQTFPDRYPVESGTADPPGTMLATMSQWGWHSVPGGDRGDGYDLAGTLRTYQTPRGPVDYVDMSGEIAGIDDGSASAAESWLRGNPHRLDLARIGLVATPAEVTDARQRLDLWTGTITSRFRLRGVPVAVTTVCHPRRDAVAVRLTAARAGGAGGAGGVDGFGFGFEVRIAFPYGSTAWNNAADWARPAAHSSHLRRTDRGCVVHRVLDETTYLVRIDTSPVAEIRRTGRHELVVAPRDTVLELVVEFSRDQQDTAAPGFAETVAAARSAWTEFWTGGGVVELAGSRDERAAELERRIVLSQYLTAIHCAGSCPPQETGLMVNSWRGRFHLEMHWWHGAHFPLWGRAELLERGLGWYAAILPAARETARRQGHAGARWPKQVGPDGRESPSPIGPFLVWQQPHPIYLAELVRRATEPTEPGAALRRYADVVLESAAFMADFAIEGDQGHQLGPPLIPAQESYAPWRARVINPTFELAYWSWALRVAAAWRRMLGLDPEPSWERVAANLARPCVRGDGYAAIGVPPYTVAGDHPSMLYALGFVPPTDLIDRRVMRTTLRRVLAEWPWETTWGWDYPAMAMTATRLGEPESALQALLMPTAKNAYLQNGHNRQSATLPIYLPGNGGLLSAIALIAAGSDSDDAEWGRPASGFPADGGWTVRHEGLRRLP